MDGMGLSYTAVTPRASLQSDAKNQTCFRFFQLEVQERKECGFFSGPSFTVYYHFYGWTKDMFFGSLFTFLCTDPRYVFWQSPFVSAFQVA